MKRDLPSGASFAPEEIEFHGPDGVLTGYLYLPKGRRPLACIVNNHGSDLHPGSRQVSCPQIAALMTSWGYGFFFPHRRGYGRSSGTPLKQAVWAPLGSKEYDEQITERLDEECEDLQAAVAYLRGRAEIDPNRIALSGVSRGGIVSLLAASLDPTVACCASFSGGARQWSSHPKLRAKMRRAATTMAQPFFLAQAGNDFDLAASKDLAGALRAAGKTFTHRVYPAWGATESEGHGFGSTGSLVWGPDLHAFLASSL
ncbi:MAG: dienelactone hydrolase family protein [Pseudomonadota bacterium]